ncbi:hypothetical protein B0O99DRAFT_691894 [Bisporella sp. PMI_857]|nr:hypothetical protein B0O99DRAFT_691894 [Bisporella sp. PMI_857]
MSEAPTSFAASNFDNWKEYPAHLKNEQLHLDVAELKERLTSDANRLFVSDSESKPQLLSLDRSTPGAHVVKQEYFTSAERLGLELARISPRKDLKVFLSFRLTSTRATPDAKDSYITQAFSWSRLLISEDHCLKLFTYLRIHPSFLDILHMSGEKIAPVEESFAAQFTRISPPLLAIGGDAIALKRGYELGYSIKYVEKHGRKLGDPYSLRETGVYQKWDPTSEKGDWIFMQPSGSMKSLLETMFPCTTSRDSAYLFRLHVAILMKASSNWRFYINYLEDVFSKIVDRGFYTNIRGPSHDGDIDADFSDIRKLQILTDKLRRLSHVLHMNTELALAFQDFARRLRDAWGTISDSEIVIFEEFDSGIEQFLFQHRTHKSRIDSILERAAGISSLVRTILNFRDVESNNRIVQSLRDTTLQGVMQNRKLEKISLSSAQDTKSMMIIALITTIFLPATFVATFFGSNFFGFETTQTNGNQLKVASNVWIYVVVTFVLLVFTVGGGWACWLRSRPTQGSRSGNQGDEESISLERVNRGTYE